MKNRNAIGLRRGAALLALPLLGLSATAHAYVGGVHFYLTYMMAHWCGIDQYQVQMDHADPVSEAYLISWSDMRVDSFGPTDAGAGKTEWLNPAKISQRWIFHFPVKPDSLERVQRASPWAWKTVEFALDGNGGAKYNPVVFGIGMHTLQDSYSHEGYTAVFGHWKIDPDYPVTDVPKSMELAETTWLAMDRWSRQVHGQGCGTSFNDVSGLVETWFSVPAHDGAIIEAELRKDAEAVIGQSLPSDLLNDQDAWSQIFLSAASDIKKFHGSRW